MPTPKFPTVEDRAKLLKELNDAIKGSDSALVRKEYFNNYIQSLEFC